MTIIAKTFSPDLANGMKAPTRNTFHHCALILLIGLAALLSSSRPADAQTLTPAEKAYLAQKGTIVFISQSLYPPFEFVDTDGEHTGMSIELARWMSTELGFKTRFTDAAFNDAQEAILSGRADVLTSLFYSPKRDADFDFTHTVFKVPAYIFVAADRPDIRELRDLDGKTIAMQRGDYAQEFLDTRHINVDVRPTRNFAEAVDLVIGGDADALIGDEQIVMYHVYSRQLTRKIKKVGEPLFVGNNCMAVKQGNPQLLTILQKGIDLAQEKGVLARINRKWLGLTYDVRHSFWERNKLIIGMLSCALLLTTSLVWLWNTRLRKAVDQRTRALSASEHQLRLAKLEWERTFDSISDMVMVLGKDLGIERINRAMAQAFNMNAEEMQGLKCYALLHQMAAPPLSCPHMALLEDRQAHGDEIYLKRLNAHFQVSVTPLHDDRGQLIGSVHVARDITERKLNEDRVKAISQLRGQLIQAHTLEEKLAFITAFVGSTFGHTLFRIWMQPDTAGADAEAAPQQVAGIEKIAEAATGIADADVHTLDVREAGYLATLMQRKEDRLKIVDHDGGYDYFGYGILSTAGTPIGVFSLFCLDSFPAEDGPLLEAVADAAVRTLQAEHAARSLKASEDRYRQLFESLIDVYFHTDTEGRIALVSPSIEQVTGTNAEAVIGTFGLEFMADPSAWQGLREKIRREGLLRNESIALRKVDGSTIWCDFNAQLIRDGQGRIKGFEGLFRDVTHAKQVEHLMRIQRDLGKALGGTGSLTPALTVCLDAALEVQDVDGGGIYLIDRRSGCLELATHRGLHPAFIAAVAHVDRNGPQALLVRDGKPVFGTYTAIAGRLNISLSDGAMPDAPDMRALAVVPMVHDERVVGCLNAVSRHVDGFDEFARFSLETIAAQMAGALVRIETDQALKNSQRNFQSLFESLGDFLFIFDDEGRIVEINPVVEQRLGYTADAMRGMSILRVHPPDRREEAAAIVARLLTGEADSCPIPLITYDGQRIPVETKVTRGIWDGRPVLFGISRDISRRLAAEEAQRTSEARLAAALDAIDEGFVIYDAEDRLVMCNARCLEIYPQAADLFKPGVRFETLVRESLRRGQFAVPAEAHEDWAAEWLRHHRLGNEQLEQQLSDGRWVRIAERRMADGSTVGFRVDITDFKRTEAAIRKALREKEVLLKEVHHRVKNNLAVIASLLNLQAKRSKDAKVRSAMQDSQARVRAMALIHETLYQHDNLAVVQFEAYVRKLVRWLHSLYGDAADRIDTVYDIAEIDLDIGQSVSLGLILNELVTNALKYAFPDARAGKINIFVRMVDDMCMELRLKDDGIGLPPEFDWRRPETLGLRIVSLMVDQLQGTWEIHNTDGLEVVMRCRIQPSEENL